VHVPSSLLVVFVAIQKVLHQRELRDLGYIEMSAPDPLPVSQIIEDLSTFISQSQIGGVLETQEFIKKVKSLLPPIINNSLRIETGMVAFREHVTCEKLSTTHAHTLSSTYACSHTTLANVAEVRSILSLLRGFSERSPQVFYGDTLGRLIFKLLLFMVEPRFKSVHKLIVETTKSFLALLYGM
jgi:hypothetical protein